MWETLKEAIHFHNKTVPVALLGTERFFAHHYGSSVIDFATDFDIMLAAELSAFKEYDSICFIPGVWPDFSAPIILPSVFGAKFRWFDDAPATVTEPPVQDIRSFLDAAAGDVRRMGIIPWYLQGLRKFHNAGVFREFMQFSWSIGPGELAGYLIGYTPMFTTLMDEPDLLYRVFRKCTETIIEFLEAQFETVPYFSGMLITDDISGLISKDQYEKVLKPHHQRIRSYFHDKIIVFHNDTASNHIIESIADIEFDVFNFGPTTDIDLLIKHMVVPKKTALMGNIDPTGILLSQDTNIVKAEISRVVSIAEQTPGFIVSAGGGLNATPKTNMRLLAEAAGKAVRHG
jgi:uroporphyrinogen decarboxylase